MKKFLLILMVMPLFALSQTKNLISTSRYFPKSGKWQAFEKALSVHAKKYHKGDFAWKVFTIETGPDAGGYLVVEGANNWAAVDSRGNLGDVHTADWENNIQPLLENKTTSTYYTFREDLSTVAQKDYAEKISINHAYIKPGWRGEYFEYVMQTNKKLWVADTVKMAVYDNSLSGRPEVITVTRYTNGLKVRDIENPVSFPDRFKKANGGDAAWTKWLEVTKEGLAGQWSELLYLKTNLGSN